MTASLCNLNRWDVRLGLRQGRNIPNGTCSPVLGEQITRTRIGKGRMVKTYDSVRSEDYYLHAADPFAQQDYILTFLLWDAGVSRETKLIEDQRESSAFSSRTGVSKM